MKARIEDRNICGIYRIFNKQNDKCYIGKSIDIFSRIRSHIYLLVAESRSEDCNRYLFYSVKKYGLESFDYEVIEKTNIDNLAERELYWMKVYRSLEENLGYNLRSDSDSQTIVHSETRKLLSERSKGANNGNYKNYWSDEMKDKMSVIKSEQYRSGELKPNLEALKKGTNTRNENWKNNPELKKQMAWKVADAGSNNYILMFKGDELIATFDHFLHLQSVYPDFTRSCVFGVCNGSKKSYKGFIFRYQNKWTGAIRDFD